jgi:hypothetical protein
MTSNECCDDVGWRAYLGTSQRNHDHPPLDGCCVHSANGFCCNLVAAFFFFVETLFLKFCDFAKGGCCVSRASCVSHGFRLTRIES